MPIARLSFLIPGNYAEADPHAGLESTLRVIELANGWVITAPRTGSVP